MLNTLTNPPIPILPISPSQFYALLSVFNTLTNPPILILPIPQSDPKISRTYLLNNLTNPPHPNLPIPPIPILAIVPLPANTACELNILGHDGHTLGVDSAEVGVFGESNKVGLGGFLYSQNSRGLKTEKLPEVLGNLTHKTLERCLAEEEIGGLLVPTDLTESDGSRAVAVGLLDTS